MLSHGMVKASVVLGILIGCQVSGCVPDKKAEAVQAPEARELKGTHLARYLEMIGELTSMMEAEGKEQASGQLDVIRKWVESHRSEAAKTVNGLNQDVLAMTEAEREHWRSVARPELEKKLDEFSRVQMAFQRDLTEVQKWELGEILSQLR